MEELNALEKINLFLNLDNIIIFKYTIYDKNA